MSTAEGPTEFDFVILGAGVSGLTLAWLLLDSEPLRARSILLVDGVRDDDELRTLSFWPTDDTAIESLVRHRWSAIRVAHDARDDRLPLAQHVYRTLFFADLQRATKARLLARAPHRVIDGRVSHVEEQGDHVSVTVGDARYRGLYVFDSRFRRADLNVDTQRWHLLWQHFAGWIVRTTRDVFDPATATLLDFRTADEPGTAFAYVLPFSSREALVERVRLEGFSRVAQAPARGDLEHGLREYLRRVWNVSEFDIVAREGGLTPMTDQPFEARCGERIRRIGIPAGRLKPSTGYALTRILEDGAAIVRSLEAHGHPFAAPRRSRVHALMDSVMLELWQHEPARVPEIFTRLFTRTDPDLVLRFLDERSHPDDIVQILAALPREPFVRAASDWYRRRFTAR